MTLSRTPGGILTVIDRRSPTTETSPKDVGISTDTPRSLRPRRRGCHELPSACLGIKITCSHVLERVDDRLAVFAHLLVHVERAPALAVVDVADRRASRAEERRAGTHALDYVCPMPETPRFRLRIRRMGQHSIATNRVLPLEAESQPHRLHRCRRVDHPFA